MMTSYDVEQKGLDLNIPPRMGSDPDLKIGRAKTAVWDQESIHQGNPEPHLMHQASVAGKFALEKSFGNLWRIRGHRPRYRGMPIVMTMYHR